ncbi:MAG: RDD family protein [Phycisphaeraceae bacterium]
MTYATFWQRFWAMWIDFLVLLPVIALSMWLNEQSRAMAMLTVIPATSFFFAYTIYCHGRFGKTLGKHAMGIRVVLTNGQRIGWREAFLRSSVDIALSILGIIARFIALTKITDAEFNALEWLDRGKRLYDLEPPELAWVTVASQVWIWSELVIMLTNKERRALHDFIAGTVVRAEGATVAGDLPAPREE